MVKLKLHVSSSMLRGFCYHYEATLVCIEGSESDAALLKFSGLSHEMDLAFDDMHGQFLA
jgi:hypothetical protein